MLCVSQVAINVQNWQTFARVRSGMRRNIFFFAMMRLGTKSYAMAAAAATAATEIKDQFNFVSFVRPFATNSIVNERTNKKKWVQIHLYASITKLRRNTPKLYVILGSSI